RQAGAPHQQIAPDCDLRPFFPLKQNVRIAAMIRPPLLPHLLSIGAGLLAFAGPAAAQGEYDCMIEAKQAIEIRSPVEAMIESVRVKRGDPVQRGQVLVTLESGPERAAFALAQSRAQAVGEIK